MKDGFRAEKQQFGKWHIPFTVWILRYSDLLKTV